MPAPILPSELPNIRNKRPSPGQGIHDDQIGTDGIGGRSAKRSKPCTVASKGEVTNIEEYGVTTLMKVYETKSVFESLL
jgi:hypothetical protein